MVLLVARRFRTDPSSFVDGSGLALLAAAQVAVFVVVLIVCSARPADATTNALSTTVLMLMALVAVPGRFRTQIVLAAGLAAGLVVVAVVRFHDPALPVGPLVANLLGALLLGAAMLSMFNRRQREQWRATRSERAARERLDAELVVAAQLRAELQQLARQDPLTHAANRRELLRVASERLTGRADPEPLSLVVLDVDRFKSVNDRFGHAAGDAALVDLVDRIEGVLRPDDLLARLGGEEFAVLLPGIDDDRARSVGERIRAAVAEGVRVGPMCEPLTVSVGVATARRGDDVDSLLARADAAMYSAKRSGRNAVRVEADRNESAQLAGALVEVDHQ
jgi:diguanylate cyclase (GGDEF)-like protein